MIIDASLIRKYQKIVTRMMDSNQPIFDSILLDFKNQVATFGSQKGFGTIKMPVTGASGDEKPFFVNTIAFLAVVEAFPVLELDGYTFKSGADNAFEIAHIEDDSFSYPDFIQSDDSLELALTKPILSAIKRAGSFTDPEAAASLNGVFILNGNIYGTNKLRMYVEYAESCKDITYAFPRSVWETLVLDVLGENLSVRKNESQFFITANDEISLQFAMSTELAGPDVTADRFVASYNHAEKITLDRATLGELSNFFVPFVAGVDSNRVRFIFNDTEMEIRSEDGNIISRKMPLTVSTPDYFKDQHVWISNSWLKTIMGVLPEGDKLVIQVNFEKPALNFFIEGKPEHHICYSRLKETT